MSLSFQLRRTRRPAAVALAGALSLGLAACASGDDDDEAADDASHGELTVQYSWIKNEEFAGEFYAEERGYYEDAGFSEVTAVAGPSTGVAELLEETVDVALSDAASVGAAIAEEDVPLKIIGATFQKNPFTILSLKDGADIQTPEDLKGKKIGVQSSNENVFNALLNANGISRDEVEVVPVQFDPTPLIEGEVDGFMAYLTNEAITVGAQQEVTNLAYAENGVPYVAETFTITDAFLAENREALKDFLIAEIKGWTDVFQEPTADTVDLVEKFYNAGAEAGDINKDFGPLPPTTGESLEAEKELISTEETEANGLFTISEDLQAETVASLAAAGWDVAADDLFDTSLLEEIYEESPELKDYLP
ncbi:ABC transporter substrate-binding protein [Nocardioides pelophilus]|uniref:ABC transporter substrate-binding protein n=1 Tax=Nocardioides pelophilus TaxID=2172019 RepID=UPI001601484B|nr:ABC transporter substrate-binding protein [Nocardioides pelophilus]